MQATSETWLSKLCGAPLIGDWAATFVGLMPIILLVLVRMLFGIEGDPGAWFLLVGAIVLAPWLIVLERWQGVRIVTPYLPIKLLWIVPVLAIGAVAELLGWL